MPYGTAIKIAIKTLCVTREQLCYVYTS